MIYRKRRDGGCVQALKIKAGIERDRHTFMNPNKKDKRTGRPAGKIVATVVLIVAAAAVIFIGFRLGEESAYYEPTESQTVSGTADSGNTESIAAENTSEGTSASSGAEASSGAGNNAETASSKAESTTPTVTINPLLEESATDDSFWEGCPARKIELLTPNEYSRPQLKMTTVNRVVIHYTANPGTTAEQNREYFESLAQLKTRHASAHFIVDLDGTIVQCVPISEVAYAQVHANYDSISIECCHPDDTGQFNDATFYSASDLAAFFCQKFGLDPESQVVRHYDVTGKDCPKYYVEHEDAWKSFLAAVQARYDYLTGEGDSSSGS